MLVHFCRATFFCGQLWTLVDSCGLTWTHVDSCGQLWTVVDDCVSRKNLDYQNTYTHTVYYVVLFGLYTTYSTVDCTTVQRERKPCSKNPIFRATIKNVANQSYVVRK